MLILLTLLVICVALVIGIPVPFAFGLALVYMYLTGDHDPAGFLTSGHWRMNVLVLLAIPLFIMAGTIMERGKIAQPLVELAELFVGRFKGGIAYAAVGASAVFGSIAGSATATLTCIGSIMMPQLRRANYPEGLSAALITNAAPLGLLIPPSAIQIIYAWVTRQSVLKCFLATIVPGLILVVLLCIVNYIMLRKYNNIKILPKSENFTGDVAKKSRFALPALLMPFMILGGIYGGIMTPTEAAGIAVVYAIPVGFFIYKGLNKDNFKEALVQSATTTGVVMVMFFMVMIVSRLLIFEDIPTLAKDLIFSVSDNPIVVLIMVNVVMILIGMLMDDVSGVLLASPLLFPIVVELGVDPIQFAAIVGVNLGMGNITPPTAPLLYLGSRVTGVRVSAMLKPTLIMILFAWIPTLIITTYVPQVSLFLPKLFLG
ncbi:TRAP transporter large permease [Pontibacterium granulatum]|uniref:TRAP transporter large permease n=1 Tax=Pontibacterium granulatum TaxID=2036029 RepID=UPI00249B7D85|nr:TRAP transporter large permease [Pontibacterium granulatum]MDI3326482.1 TRAP transporter large permease [Pontibacterium granulatum]